MFPYSNTRPSEPIFAVKFTSAVKTFAVMFLQTFAVMFLQTFAVILTGRVKLNVCVVSKVFAVILVGHRKFGCLQPFLMTRPSRNNGKLEY